MSQYNKLSNIQYARFQILPVELHYLSGNYAVGILKLNNEVIVVDSCGKFSNFQHMEF